MSQKLSKESPPNSETNRFLTELGKRVRGARSLKGMTRKLLAQHSGVSERYLAQLENGRSNISIVLLRKVANAVGIEVAKLVREKPNQPSDIEALDQESEKMSSKSKA